MDENSYMHIMGEKIVYQKVKEEQFQAHITRVSLYKKLEKEIGTPVISLFTSFKYPVILDDNDADMLEGLLQKCHIPDNFTLFINSPGGSGLAAERIINICRTYSKTGEYQVIVTNKAKSAATMICLGASKIIMSKTSELGAVDPILYFSDSEGKQDKMYSVYNIIKSYESLFSNAIKEEGNLEPYLQQLANFDAKDIEEMRSAMSLSHDIVIKALKNGMLNNLNESAIKKKVKIFLSPEKVKTHGRPIYASDALDAGLTVEIPDLKGKMWSTAYELSVRLSNYVSSNHVAKCIECKDYSFKATMNEEINDE